MIKVKTKVTADLSLLLVMLASPARRSAS